MKLLFWIVCGVVTIVIMSLTPKPVKLNTAIAAVIMGPFSVVIALDYLITHSSNPCIINCNVNSYENHK